MDRQTASLVLSPSLGLLLKESNVRTLLTIVSHLRFVDLSHILIPKEASACSRLPKGAEELSLILRLPTVLGQKVCVFRSLVYLWIGLPWGMKSEPSLSSTMMVHRIASCLAVVCHLFWLARMRGVYSSTRLPCREELRAGKLPTIIGVAHYLSTGRSGARTVRS